MTKTKRSRILFLTYDGLSDHIGQSQILPYILGCKRNGIDIDILSFEKKSKKQSIEKIASLLEKEQIRWHKVSFSEGGNLSKFYDFIKFIFSAFRISSGREYKIIHCRSYTAGSTGLLLKMFLGKKLIFDKRDFWIDAKIESGRLNLSKWSHRFIDRCLRFFEKRLFLKSDHIVSLTEKGKEVVLKKYPSRNADEITVIPCCVDLSLFNKRNVKDEEGVALKKSLGLDGALVLGYVGSVGPAYMIPELLSCFRHIKSHIPRAKLLFLVNNNKEEVYKLSDKAGVSRDDIRITSAPRAQMPLYISIINCGIYFITPTYAKQASSPTKLSEMLALGKPIITNEGVGDVHRIFSELQCGYLIHTNSDLEYEGAAQWLDQHKGDYFNFNLKNYSLDFGISQYLKVYRQLLSE